MMPGQPSRIACFGRGAVAIAVLLAPAVAGARIGGGGFAHAGGSFQRPAGGFQRPAGGFQRPSGGFQRPAGGLQKPAGGLQRPGGGGGGIQRQGFNRPNGAARPGQGGANANVNRQRMSDRRAVNGGTHVTNNARGNVVAGNTVVAGGGQRFPNGARPGGAYAGGRPLSPPPPMPYPAYNGYGPGWDVGSAVVGGLVAGATIGVVGAIAANATQPVVVAASPPYPYPYPPSMASDPATSAEADRAAAAADDAKASADKAAAAANQARRSAQSAPRPAGRAAAPPVAPAAPPAPADAAAMASGPAIPGPSPGAPPGTRYAYGVRFLQPVDGCIDEKRGPIAFEHCGTDWLQPVMQGGTVYYVAVPPPG